MKFLSCWKHYGCFYCMIFSPLSKKNSSFYSIKATLLVLHTQIFAMLNEKKVKNVEKTCYYYYYYYRIIPDYTIILSRKKEIHIVIVLGHTFLSI